MQLVWIADGGRESEKRAGDHEKRVFPDLRTRIDIGLTSDAVNFVKDHVFDSCTPFLNVRISAHQKLFKALRHRNQHLKL